MPTPFVPGPNVLEIDAIYFQGTEKVENVFHLQGAAAWSESTIIAALGTYSTWEAAWAASRRASNVNLTLLVGRDLTTATSLSLEQVEDLAGTDTGQHLPNNVTVAIKAVTGFRGRSFRGRTYWIGLTATYLEANGSFINATEAGRLIDAMNALRTAAWPNSAQLVVFSRRHDNAWRTTGVATPIERYVLTDEVVDSQRRRLPGHNIHR